MLYAAIFCPEAVFLLFLLDAGGDYFMGHVHGHGELVFGKQGLKAYGFNFVPGVSQQGQGGIVGVNEISREIMEVYAVQGMVEQRVIALLALADGLLGLLALRDVTGGENGAVERSVGREQVGGGRFHPEIPPPRRRGTGILP